MNDSTGDDPVQHHLTVAPAQAGMRLDRFLAESLPDLSRTRLRGLIDAGRLEGEAGTAADPAAKTRAGQRWVLTVPPAEELSLEPQSIPLDILYEDNHLIVIDKPAGLVVHPAPGNPDRTLVNALLAHCGDGLTGIGNARRPGIVHRLDKDTSGVLVAAKTDVAHKGLVAQFAAHDIDRVYRALAWGVPVPPAGEITGNIGRSPADRKKMAVVARGGRPAITRYRVVERFGEAASLIECRLLTGRTHQIRVHLSVKGHPLIGDGVYGVSRKRKMAALPEAVRAAAAGFPRQALHACRLGFRHPVTGETLSFESALPPDIAALAACFKNM